VRSVTTGCAYEVSRNGARDVKRGKWNVGEQSYMLVGSDIYS
jgi:hypothetical protein